MARMAGPLPPLRLALAQVNSRVGDLEGNAERIRRNIEQAREAGAELVLFPELAITGYPPEDLLLKEHFLRAARDALDSVARSAEGIVAIVGFPERRQDVFNSIAVCCGGDIVAIYRKTRLWNYGVADEERYFQAGDGGAVLDLGEARIGLTVCEDLWVPGVPASDEALAGAALIVNASASPYQRGKGLERERMLGQRARDNLCAVAFCNLVGGQDELVFDGHSVVVNHRGDVLAGRRSSGGADGGTVDLQAARDRAGCGHAPAPAVRALRRTHGALRRRPRRRDRWRRRGRRCSSPRSESVRALCLGVRDYAPRTRSSRRARALGGIDSTLVADRGRRARADRVTAV
jgi:NAD+ synthase (glutamine-hydrolysing)